MVIKSGDISQRIKQARKALDLTQEYVGKKLGLSKQAIQSYESGRTQPSLENIEKLAAILKVNVQWLITGEMVTARIPLDLQRDLAKLPRHSEQRAEMIITRILAELGMNNFMFYPDVTEQYLAGELGDSEFYQRVHGEVQTRIDALRSLIRF